MTCNYFIILFLLLYCNAEYLPFLFQSVCLLFLFTGSWTGVLDRKVVMVVLVVVECHDGGGGGGGGGMRWDEMG